jgi:hypothetical protein
VKRSLLLSLLALAAALPALPAHPPANAATPAASAGCAAAPSPVAATLGLAAPAVSADRAINCTLFCETKNCPSGTTCGLDGKTNKCGCI